MKNIRCSILYLIIEHIYSTYFFYLFSTYFYILDAAFRLYIPTSLQASFFTTFFQTSVSVFYSTYFFYLFYLLPVSFSVRHLSRHQFIYCILPTFPTYFLPTFSLQLLDMTFIQTFISFFIIFYLLFLPLFYLLLHLGCSFSITPYCILRMTTNFQT